MLDSALLDYLDGLHVALDPAIRFERVIGTADDWQKEFLRSTSEFTLVLCSRQVGKSTSTACLAWDAATRGKMVLIQAPAERQAKELLRRCHEFRNADLCAPRVVRTSMTTLELVNGGRIECIPAANTARGYTVDLLIIEEAAFVPDDAITAVLPARRQDGRVVMISTPAGRQGFFYETWTAGKVERIFARSVDIPRLAEKVEFDRRYMPALKFRQEILGEFLGSGTPFFDPLSLEQAITTDMKALIL